MPAAIHLIQADSPAREHLASLLADRGATVTLSQPNGDPAVTDCDAAVFLADEDPLAPGGVPASGVVAGWADAAAAANARFILCSSVLLYSEGGDEELMANDPEIGHPPELRPLSLAELELFGSSAEVMLLRLGIVLGQGGSGTEELAERVKSGNLPVPEGQQNFVPLLDRETLADALVEVAPSRLHGGWDLVSDDVQLAELVAFTVKLLGAPEAITVPREQAIAAAGAHAATRWLTSRKVTGRDLRETGAVQSRPWHETVKEALA